MVTGLKTGLQKSKRLRTAMESVSRVALLAAALISIAAVVLITLFIVQQGLPMFSKVPASEFFLSTVWTPSASNPHYGIASFIIASFEVTFLAMIFSLPIALSCAIYLSEFAKGKFAGILRSAIELLAGIPSIIYGLFGIALVVPAIRNTLGGNGYSLLSAGIILAIMILPTIINFSEVSIRAVSKDLRMASVAMGATPWQTIYKVVLPSAMSGIVSSVVLGLGRAIGETTAVLLVGGNAPVFAIKPTDMGRTMTMNIITDMSYATGVHMEALFATAMLLFLFILLLNALVVEISRRSRLEN
ncbi:MAG: phosphate ABC transporter permease subunit PstC [Spirochaetia bacterium]|jgi:phosphate transport system permease protein|nr:phosphate ABC transporter permease subunit PstC [Spirochaetia bacterium]